MGNIVVVSTQNFCLCLPPLPFSLQYAFYVVCLIDFLTACHIVIAFIFGLRSGIPVILFALISTIFGLVGLYSIYYSDSKFMYIYTIYTYIRMCFDILTILVIFVLFCLIYLSNTITYDIWLENQKTSLWGFKIFADYLSTMLLRGEPISIQNFNQGSVFFEASMSVWLILFGISIFLIVVRTIFSYIAYSMTEYLINSKEPCVQKKMDIV